MYQGYTDGPTRPESDTHDESRIGRAVPTADGNEYSSHSTTRSSARRRRKGKRERRRMSWSGNQAYDTIVDASEEFFTRFGFTLTMNMFRFLCSFTSGMKLFKKKFAHRLSDEMSIVQLLAVALTLPPWQYGTQIISIGLISAMLGLMLTVAPTWSGMHFCYFFMMNLAADLTWHAGVHGPGMEIVKTYTKKEFELTCLLTGFIIGLFAFYGQLKIWYVELVTAQDKAEAEVRKQIDAKKSG